MWVVLTPGVEDGSRRIVGKALTGVNLWTVAGVVSSSGLHSSCTPIRTGS